MTVNAVIPISSGSHAPWTILVRLAATNSRSTESSRVAPVAISHTGVPHFARATEKNSRVVMVLVPVTAMPNAKAGAAELRNAKTRVRTETISSQLIRGTQI